jgi:hypothetical protein
MSDEIGEEGTYHTHLYFALANGIRFSRVKTLFDGAHIEMANGTHQQNRDYIYKEGKWLKDKKKDTNLRETHEENGEMPLERQGARNDIAEQYDMIKQGFNNYEILEQFEGNVDLTRVERMRLTFLSEKYRSQEREIKVIYSYGPTHCGKTTAILRDNGYENVYKIDDWKHPFDSYNCEPILLLDDWRCGLTLITDMLHWLDKFPLKLSCRYANKQACYTTVYITSNEPLEHVYNGENTKVSEETRKAFLRRIHEVRIYKADYTYTSYETNDYFKRKETEFISVEEYNQAEFPWVVQ